MDAPLIFTPEVLAQAAEAARNKPYTASLLLRLAALPRKRGGDALRTQIEQVAALVPHAQRSRILGPLGLPAPPEENVRSRLGELLLAKMLDNLGWHVTFEPKLEGGTPDYLIAKGDEAYVVEVHSVSRLATSICEDSVARIRDKLHGLLSHTPISIRSASVPGTSSLKPFVAYLKRLLSSSPAPGEHVFHKDQVLIVFRTLAPLPEPMPVFFGSSGSGSGNYCSAIRAHIDGKLKKYKIPLIVALDFFDPFDAFDDVVDVLLGEPVMRIPVAFGDEPPENPTYGRADDGLVLRPDAQGERARRRLQAVLPFHLATATDGRYAVRARILANPMAPSRLDLAPLAPIPRLIVIGETEGEPVMHYVDERGEPFGAEPTWLHVP